MRILLPLLCTLLGGGLFLAAIIVPPAVDSNRPPPSKRANGRIVGGQEVNLMVYPAINYQVGVQAGAARCGGAIINNRWIVSAAHCFYDRVSEQNLVTPGQVTVRTGIMFDNTPRAIDAIYMPDSYTTPGSPESGAQDIALLHLVNPLVFGGSVGRVALPDASCGDCEGPGTQYIVSGYGLDECPAIGPCTYSNAEPVNTLRWVNVRFASRATCDTANPSITIASDVICADGIDPDLQDSCQGDSGGPLVVDEGPGASPRYKLAGIVSGGTATTDPLCAVPGQYGIYTGVATNRAWIDGIISGTTTSFPPTGPPLTSAAAFHVTPSIFLIVMTFFFLY